MADQNTSKKPMPITNVKAVRDYFEADGGRKVNMAELKALSKEDRIELGALAAIELGTTIAPTTAMKKG